MKIAEKLKSLSWPLLSIEETYIAVMKVQTLLFRGEKLIVSKDIKKGNLRSRSRALEKELKDFLIFQNEVILEDILAHSLKTLLSDFVDLDFNKEHNKLILRKLAIAILGVDLQDTLNRINFEIEDPNMFKSWEEMDRIRIDYAEDAFKSVGVPRGLYQPTLDNARSKSKEGSKGTITISKFRELIGRKKEDDFCEIVKKRDQNFSNPKISAPSRETQFVLLKWLFSSIELKQEYPKAIDRKRVSTFLCNLISVFYLLPLPCKNGKETAHEFLDFLEKIPDSVTNIDFLKLLKEEKYGPSYRDWELAWKNYLGSTEVKLFELEYLSDIQKPSYSRNVIDCNIVLMRLSNTFLLTLLEDNYEIDFMNFFLPRLIQIGALDDESLEGLESLNNGDSGTAS